ncbi:hypothetical protein TNCV_5017831 [Trichonephila clavipes]|nr:hypothetical protein TNCV_5017831 [Trichonephila clavipes]
MFEKVSALLDCPTLSLEEFIVVNYNNTCTSPIMAGKDILEFVQSSKNMIDPDSDEEKEMDNAGHVPLSSEIGNVRKSKFRRIFQW